MKKNLLKTLCALMLVFSVGIVMAGCKDDGIDLLKASDIPVAVLSDIKEDYAKFRGVDVSIVIVAKYYGTFDGGLVVMMDTIGGNWPTLVWSEIVGGYEFGYNDGNYIVLWHNKQFIPLKESHEQGLLTVDDLKIISQRHGKSTPKATS